MANYDHRDNIGTHPAFSDDPETRLRARFDAAGRRLTQAAEDYTAARNDLARFYQEREVSA